MDSPTGSWLGSINASQWAVSCRLLPIGGLFRKPLRPQEGHHGWLRAHVCRCSPAGISPNTTGFLLGRILVGQPCAWWGGLAPVLITELAYPTYRAFFTSLYQCGWYVGSSLAAWVMTFGTRNYGNDWAWRIPSLLQLIIPIIVLPAAFLVPESPRYLVPQGQSGKARAIITKFHAVGDDSSPLVDFEMAEIEQAIAADSKAAASTSWAHLFSTKGNRHRAFITITLRIFAQWVGNNVVSYYLSMILDSIGITSVTEQTLINGGHQIWNLIFDVSAAVGVDVFGRRPLFVVSTGDMFVTFSVVTALCGVFASTEKSGAGIAVIPFLYFYYAFFDIAYTPLLVGYTTEIWPYELGARGVAMMNMVASCAIFFNVFANPIALAAIAWKFYFLFLAVIAVAFFTIFFYYPEAKGHSLEEMAVLFDGEQAATSYAAADAHDNKEATVHSEEA